MGRITYSQLDNTDPETVRGFLNARPLHNLYLIHGYECVRYQAPTASEFWGAWEDGRLVAMLYVDIENSARARVGYLAACSDDGASTAQALAHLGALAANRADVRVLSGPQAYIEPALIRLAKRTHVKRAHLYKVDSMSTAVAVGAERPSFVRYSEYPVRQATRDDLPRLVELYREYEYSRANRADAEIAAEIERAMAHSGTYFYLEPPYPQPSSETSIVCAARIYPETDRAGMIGAARTLPTYRGRGMYLSVRTAGFDHLVRQGKTGLGFFMDTNASMHRVLEKQGGTILGEWWIVHVRPMLSLTQRIRRSRPWRELRARLIRQGSASPTGSI